LLSIDPGLQAVSAKAGGSYWMASQRAAFAAEAHQELVMEPIPDKDLFDDAIDDNEFDIPEEPWDRKPGEPTKAYGAFRIYRDLTPTQRNHRRVADAILMSERRIRGWASSFDWRERAEAWDDACHRVEDRERLEAIRQMHGVHRDAGRKALEKALQALSHLDPQGMHPTTIARLMELGAKLERQTLIVSVEELQGIDNQEEEIDDPWERIARELDPTNINQTTED
jgi:hypothetical protein